MASTSPDRLAEAILAEFVAGRPYPEAELGDLARLALAADTAVIASQALFGILIERLGDLFEPALCLAYADLFAHIVSLAFPEVRAGSLRERYRRVRQTRRFAGDAGSVRDVFVLSRVTLGADVAVTSVILQAAKRKFPQARIHLVGPAKNHALFAADKSIFPAELPYGRTATLRSRLAIWQDLQRLVSRPASIVIDPDSRLSQLGILPICPEDDYYFFESRSYGGDGCAPLGVLAAGWAHEVFGIDDCRPYLAPVPVAPVTARPRAAVSLGVGGNTAKSVSEEFERDLLSLLADHASIVLDRGFGPAESSRADRASAGLQSRLTSFEGEFAPFASHIAQADLYVGYDSAGQHVAAAAGVPCLVFFKGFVSERMYQRWQPVGSGWRRVIRIEGEPRADLLEQARRALNEWSRVSLTENLQKNGRPEPPV